MRRQNISIVISLFSTLSFLSAIEQPMPFSFHSKDRQKPFEIDQNHDQAQNLKELKINMKLIIFKNRILNFEEDLYSSKEELLNKFARIISKKAQSGVKIIVINVKTPSSLSETISFIKEQAKYLPQLTNLVQSYFRSQIVYDSSIFIKELQNNLEKFNIQVELDSSEVQPNQVTIQQTNVQLDDISQLEQNVKQAQEQIKDEDAQVFVVFTEDKAFISQKKRILQGTDIQPSMVQIPTQTLFGLILLFTLFLPVLVIGISCLYGIESPEKFVTQNLVVGKEY